MSILWTSSGIYRQTTFDREKTLEECVILLQRDLFGGHRIYLEIKKKIGLKGSQNIPDGYLIDLTGSKPKLYVVEVELAEHDHLRHIATQILQFSLSFEEQPRLVRQILLDAIMSRPDVHHQIEQYIRQQSHRSLDQFVDMLIYDERFSALVIIDEIPERLETVLNTRFKFGVDIISVTPFINDAGQYVYQFEPFLSDLYIPSSSTEADRVTNEISLPSDAIDTVVIPARPEGFQKEFLGNHNWFSIRLHGSIRPQIKHIAAYQVRPISAITHVAPVESIEPIGDVGKYIVRFAAPARELPIPLRMNTQSGKIRSFQGLRYTSLSRLLSATTLDEAFFGKE